MSSPDSAQLPATEHFSSDAGLQEFLPPAKRRLADACQVEDLPFVRVNRRIIQALVLRDWGLQVTETGVVATESNPLGVCVSASKLKPIGKTTLQCCLQGVVVRVAQWKNFRLRSGCSEDTVELLTGHPAAHRTVIDVVSHVLVYGHVPHKSDLGQPWSGLLLEGQIEGFNIPMLQVFGDSVETGASAEEELFPIARWVP